MLYVKMMVCSVARNSFEVTLILQLACSNVKIGLACAHGNKAKGMIHILKKF